MGLTKVVPALFEGSTGGGALNFLTNPDADNGTVGWTVDSFAAAARPSGALTGVATGVTFATSATVPLAGQNSFVFDKDAVNRQGRVVYTGITITPAYFAKVLQITADYLVNSGTFVAGTSTTDSDVIFYLQNVTDGTFIEPSSFKLLSNSTTIADRFSATFQTAAAATSYRLLMYVASTSAAAYSLKLDNISVSPSVYIFGTPITDWQRYTLNITSSGTAPTKNASPVKDQAQWRRVGDSMEITYQYYQTTGGTAGTGNYRFSLPTGFTIDTNKFSFSNDDNNLSNCGSGSSYATGVGYTGYSFVATSTSIGIASSNDTLAQLPVSGTRAPLSGEALYNFSASVPILGWSSSVQMSDQTDTRVVAASFSTLSGTITNAGDQLVTMATTAFDTHGGWNGTTTYTNRVAGYYELAFSVGFAASVTGLVLVKYQINASTTVAVAAFTNPTQFTSVGGLTTVFLNSGDTVKFYANQNSASSQTIDLARATLKRISGPSAIAASASINARVAGATTSIPNTSVYTIVGFTSTTYDSIGGVTLGASARWTAQIQGIISVKTWVQWSAVSGGTTALAIFKNGVQYSEIAVFIGAMGQFHSLQGADDVPVLSGDYIELRAKQSGTAAVSLVNAYMSLARLGN